MRILLIDDDDLILEFLRVCLEDGLPGVEVEEYPSERLGRPTPDFEWSRFDLLLLDYNLGNGENGVEWLQSFGQQPGFPATVLITAVDDPYVVASAVKSGADGYLNKSDMSPVRLLATVKDVMRGTLTGPGKRTAAPPASAAPGPSTADPSAALGDSDVGASYRFRRCIGRGAMSAVYLAERVSDHMTVVIKILDRRLAKDPEFVQRFRMEGALVADMDSPFVVKIHDRGITNSYDYIVMEFFGRGDLKQRIEQGMSPSDALAALYNICQGLKAIHSLNIVHRDLKPANVMFRADGSIALADFGIAKRLDTDLALTATGNILGTLHYMSPEQAHGGKPDLRSDIYSAGIIFYEMLTGTRPYHGRSASAMLMQHMHAPVPTLEGRLAVFQPLLERLMAKDIEQRFQSASEVIEAIRRLSEDARTPPRDAPGARAALAG